MEINIHEELRAFWKRDREEKEHDESAMDDTLQDEVLSPASCRQTDLFDNAWRHTRHYCGHTPLDRPHHHHQTTSLITVKVGL